MQTVTMAEYWMDSFWYSFASILVRINLWFYSWYGLFWSSPHLFPVYVSFVGGDHLNQMWLNPRSVLHIFHSLQVSCTIIYVQLVSGHTLKYICWCFSAIFVDVNKISHHSYDVIIYRMMCIEKEISWYSAEKICSSNFWNLVLEYPWQSTTRKLTGLFVLVHNMHAPLWESDNGQNWAYSTEDIMVAVICICFLQLKHCHVSDPSDLCSVNISGQNLTEAVSEDFKTFHNVVVINAADNLLPLGWLEFYAWRLK